MSCQDTRGEPDTLAGLEREYDQTKGTKNMEEKTEKKRGRPPRTLRTWSAADYDELQKHVRQFQIGFNLDSREKVDLHAEAIIKMLNHARGLNV